TLATSPAGIKVYENPRFFTSIKGDSLGSVKTLAGENPPSEETSPDKVQEDPQKSRHATHDPAPRTLLVPGSQDKNHRNRKKAPPDPYDPRSREPEHGSPSMTLRRSTRLRPEPPPAESKAR